MNILHIYSAMGAGGAERMLLELAAGLEVRGAHAIVGAPLNSYLDKKSAEMRLSFIPLSIRGSFAPLGIVNLAIALRREKIDILHVHQGKLYWAAIIANALAGSPARIIFHRHMQTNHAWYSRLHYRFADRVIAVSKAVAEGLKNVDHVPSDKCVVIYNGVDADTFNTSVSGNDVRYKYGLTGNVVVGTVGAMNKPKGKGQRTLLEAAKMLERQFPDVRYLLVGDGTLRRELEERGRVLGLERKVLFVGYQDAVEKYIAAMDIFCLLSWDSEAFGQVMAEAQAMGKPVIGTRVGGIPETVLERTTGFLIEPDDPAQLAESLRAMLSDADLRARMGRAARERVQAVFRKEASFDATLALYREVLHV